MDQHQHQQVHYRRCSIIPEVDISPSASQAPINQHLNYESTHSQQSLSHGAFLAQPDQPPGQPDQPVETGHFSSASSSAGTDTPCSQLPPLPNTPVHPTGASRNGTPMQYLNPPNTLTITDSPRRDDYSFTSDIPPNMRRTNHQILSRTSSAKPRSRFSSITEKITGGITGFIKGFNSGTCISRCSNFGRSRRVQPQFRAVIPNHLISAEDQGQMQLKFSGNKIRTRKYTVLSFIPKNLFEQFHRFANIYFVTVVMLNWIPQIEAFGREIALFPVLFVLSVTAIKDLFEDHRRYKSDQKINHSKCRVYNSIDKKYIETEWRELRVGDFVHLSCNEIIPADILLLQSSDASGVCYVETSNLDGESNLKQRQAVSSLIDKSESFKPTDFASTIECEQPNNQIYKFNGFLLHPNGERESVNKNNLLLRGCAIRNTDYVEGIVLYAGHETKAMLNNSGPRYKRSKLERMMNWDIIWCVVILLLLCVVGAIGSGLWLNSFTGPFDVPFITTSLGGHQAAVEAFKNFWTYVIILQVMIPISLYVTIEIVKLGQVFFITQDPEFYHELSDKRIQCRALNIPEELGQVEYVLSDKTGTLTENQMIFRRCAVAGIDYSGPAINSTDEPPIFVPEETPRTIFSPILGTNSATTRSETAKDVVANPFLQRLLVDLCEDYSKGMLSKSRQLATVEFFINLAICNTVVVNAQPHSDHTMENGTIPQAVPAQDATPFDSPRAQTPDPPNQINHVVSPVAMLTVDTGGEDFCDNSSTSNRNLPVVSATMEPNPYSESGSVVTKGGSLLAVKTPVNPTIRINHSSITPLGGEEQPMYGALITTGDNPGGVSNEHKQPESVNMEENELEPNGGLNLAGNSGSQEATPDQQQVEEPSSSGSGQEQVNGTVAAGNSPSGESGGQNGSGRSTPNTLLGKICKHNGQSISKTAPNSRSGSHIDLRAAVAAADRLRPQSLAMAKMIFSSTTNVARRLLPPLTGWKRRSGTPSPGPATPYYEAESPDELALVYAGAAYGIRLVKREFNAVTVELPGGYLQRYQMLHVLPFDSVRKRMSVVVRHPVTNHVLVFTKGADSVIMDLLSRTFQRSKKGQQIIIKSQEYLNLYASYGLRTLCIARKQLSDLEYEAWATDHEEAEMSLEDRELLIFESACRLEKDIELLGITGIEDRLQDGVADTIANLRAAGIKVWVLTGDKIETAVNIAYACRLFAYGMQLVQLSAKTEDDCDALLQHHVDELERQRRFRQQQMHRTVADDDKTVETGGVGGGNGGIGLIVDGRTLALCLHARLEAKFVSLISKCTSVLCCRATPLQKAAVARLVKTKLKALVLGIGDGANDVSLIQCSDVGIGISGQEGMQAVMASDFAMARFRFLERLLLVHGHWCYDRLARMVLYFFYKNAMFVFTLFWFQVFNGWSAQVMIDPIYLTFYNLIFTSLPPLLLGILDQDAAAEVLLAYPILYQQGAQGVLYRTYSFWLNVIDAFWQSAIIFFVPFFVYYDSSADLWEFGTAITSGMVLCNQFHVALDVKSWTWPLAFSIGFSVLLFYSVALVYNALAKSCCSPNTPYMVTEHLLSTGIYWAVIVFIVILALLPRLTFRIVVNSTDPSPVHIARLKHQETAAVEVKQQRR